MLQSIAVQWNLSIKDTQNKEHLSNKNTVCCPNHTELCTHPPRNQSTSLYRTASGVSSIDRFHCTYIHTQQANLNMLTPISTYVRSVSQCLNSVNMLNATDSVCTHSNIAHFPRLSTPKKGAVKLNHEHVLKEVAQMSAPTSASFPLKTMDT